MPVPEALRLRVLRRDGGRCVYCRRRGASVDHITPESWYAERIVRDPVEPHDPVNLVAACALCNSTKRDMDLAVFALYLTRRYGADPHLMLARVEAARSKPLPSD